MNSQDLIFHGLVIKRHSNAEAVASLMGLPVAMVGKVLEQATASARAVCANDAYSLMPLAKLALEARYSLYFAELRDNSTFVAAYERFELINKTLKAVITDWQTMDVHGQRVANNHDDSAYDDAVIDRLGKIHDQMDGVFRQFSQHLPRLKIYQDKL